MRIPRAYQYLMAMAEHNLTQKQVAKRFNVTPQAVSTAIHRMLGPEPAGQCGQPYDPAVLDNLGPRQIFSTL